MRGKQEFKTPYVGIAQEENLDILYNLNGDFSVVIEMRNPVAQFGANSAAYDDYHNLLISLVKLLGDGYVLQKQDIFSKAKYKAQNSAEYLQQKYNAHFEGRSYVKITTYLVITRQVKRGSFYVYDQKALRDFRQTVGKVMDQLKNAVLLNEPAINRLVMQTLTMNFSDEIISLQNIAPNDSELRIGDRAIRNISLINTDNIDLPTEVGTHMEWNEKDTLKGFPVDFLSFLLRVPGADDILYNQVIDI